MIEGIASPVASIGLSGNSPQIAQVKRIIQQVCLTDVNVLITGESGTGKEIAGRLIHALSNRKHKPFVPVNCSAIPLELLESELFGHEKGAFTGAIHSRLGRFEMAQGGTIFLDEIGDMPLAMQVKILRVLQEKVFERVGSNKSVKVDVRIVAATHRNLEEEIIKGNFREDLFYRINVFPIEMPSLRERAEDIPSLVNDFINRFKSELGVSTKLGKSAIDSLIKCKWSGNIRELSNLIERLMVLYPHQTVEMEHLPKKYQHLPEQVLPAYSTDTSLLELLLKDRMSETQDVNLRELLHHIELKFIKDALDKTNGVVSHAAEKLGMRRTTLIEKMRKFQIEK